MTNDDDDDHDDDHDDDDDDGVGMRQLGLAQLDDTKAKPMGVTMMSGVAVMGNEKRDL